MKRMTAMGVVLLSAVALASDQWTTYANSRFGYSVSLPKYLKSGRPPENGDGLEFNGNGIKVLAYGSNRTFSVKQEMAFARDGWRRDHGTITSAMSSSRFFLIRGTIGKSLFVQKTLITRDKFATVSVQYPTARAKALASTVSRITGSLKVD